MDIITFCQYFFNLFSHHFDILIVISNPFCNTFNVRSMHAVMFLWLNGTHGSFMNSIYKRKRNVSSQQIFTAQMKQLHGRKSSLRSKVVCYYVNSIVHPIYKPSSLYFPYWRTILNQVPKKWVSDNKSFIYCA